MDLCRCNASVTQTPFAACGIHMHHVGTPKPASPMRRRISEQQQTVGGFRGIRQLALKNSSDANDESIVLTKLKTNDISAVPLRFLTLHKRGQLLIWDGTNSDLIGSCSHGRNYVVQHCIHTAEYIFTTVNNVEEDVSEQGGPFKVFQWNATTLQLCNTLLMERKVETIAVVGESSLLLGTETSIELYEFGDDHCKLLHTFSTREKNEEVTNIPRRMEVEKDYLFVAGSAVQLTVWSLQTKSKVASSFVDMMESSTCLQILSSPVNRSPKPPIPKASGGGIPPSPTSPSPIIVLTGSTEGNIIIWSFSLSSTTNSHPSSRPPRRSTIQTYPQGEKGGMEKMDLIQLRRASTLTSSLFPSMNTGGTTGINFSQSLNGTTGPKKISPIEKQNFHHTRVMAVLADDDIIVSADEYSGVTVMHRHSRLFTSISRVPTRSMMLDADNKRILLGDDMGVLSVFSYADYASRGQKIESLFTCRPHNGSISGLYLQLGSGNLWERVMTCSLEGSIAALDFSEDQVTMKIQKEKQVDYDLQNLVSVLYSTKGSSSSDAKETIAVAMMDPLKKVVRFLKPNFQVNSEYPPLVVAEVNRGRNANVSGIAWVDEKTLVVVYTSTVKAFHCALSSEEVLEWTDLGEWFFDPSLHQEGLPPILVSVDVAEDGTILLVGRDDRKGMGNSAFPGAGYVVMLQVNESHYLHCVYCRHIHSIPKRGRYLFSSSSPIGSGADAPSFTEYYVGVEIARGGVEVHLTAVGQRPKQVEITSDMPEPFLSKYCTDTFSVLKVDEGTSVPLRVTYLDSGNAYYADVGAHLSGLTTHIPLLKGNGVVSRKPSGDTRVASLSSTLTTDRGHIVGLCLPKFGEVYAIIIREKSNKVEVFLEDGKVAYFLTYDGDYAPVEPVLRRRPLYFPTPAHLSESNSRSPSLSGMKDVPFPSNTIPPPSTPSSSVHCCSLDSNKEGRFVCVGYSDGLVQVVDICERRTICRWFTPHKESDMRIRAVANGVLVTSRSRQEVSFYMIPCRFVYDDDNSVKPH